jgi:hypothetical protein
MYRPTLEQHLAPTHPKRILALDGGGVRGILTLSYLARIESLLRTRYGDPDLRLCDYFDLIGGTSTGAIIATGLAIGKTVAELQALYRKLATDIFQSEWYRLGLLSPKFSIVGLQSALEDTFHDYQLGGSEVQTGLMIMCKRFDTASPWVIHNHPKGRFFAGVDGSEHVPNSGYLLKQVVRASTAAPHYFQPEKIQVAGDFYGAFVDGGMSPHNNPALQLLMLATLDGYGWKWPMGETNLLLVSAGTGRKDIGEKCDDIMRMPAAGLAGRSLLNLMDDCSWLNQAVLQWIARSDTAWQVDSELGDLQSDTFGGQKWLTYQRYDLRFQSKWLKETLGLDIADKDLAGLHAMDNPRNLSQLADVGAQAAQQQIQPNHFPAAFDVAAATGTHA